MGGGGQVHLRGREEVGGPAGGGGKAVQAVAVAGAAALTPVTVDRRLKLPGGTQPLLLTLIRVEVLHIPERERERDRECMMEPQVREKECMMEPFKKGSVFLASGIRHLFQVFRIMEEDRQHFISLT